MKTKQNYGLSLFKQNLGDFLKNLTIIMMASMLFSLVIGLISVFFYQGDWADVVIKYDGIDILAIIVAFFIGSNMMTLYQYYLSWGLRREQFALINLINQALVSALLTGFIYLLVTVVPIVNDWLPFELGIRAAFVEFPSFIESTTSFIGVQMVSQQAWKMYALIAAFIFAASSVGSLFSIARRRTNLWITLLLGYGILTLPILIIRLISEDAATSILQIIVEYFFGVDVGVLLLRGELIINFTNPIIANLALGLVMHLLAYLINRFTEYK